MFKTDSCCDGGRHRSGTVKICIDITNKGSKVLFGYCSKCNWKKSLTVSDNTIQAEGLGNFFKNQGKKGLNVSKQLAKNVIRNSGRASEIGANVGSAFASRSPKQKLSSLPEIISF